MQAEQITQPAENIELERRIEDLAAYHAMKLPYEARHDIRAVLLGRRMEYRTWDKEACALHLDQYELANVITHELPEEFLAKVLVLVLDGDEALRADLRASLNPLIEGMVERHVDLQSVQNAIQDIEEQDHDYQR